jgi:hypothetical protein
MLFVTTHPQHLPVFDFEDHGTGIGTIMRATAKRGFNLWIGSHG